MNKKQKDIEYLLNYLKGDLSGEEQHALEADMDTNPFLKDALEGLEQSSNNEDEIRSTLLLLQKNLSHQINHRKRRRLKSIRPSSGFWVTALIILIILLAAGLMFRAFLP